MARRTHYARFLVLAVLLGPFIVGKLALAEGVPDLVYSQSSLSPTLIQPKETNVTPPIESVSTQQEQSAEAVTDTTQVEIEQVSQVESQAVESQAVESQAVESQAVESQAVESQAVESQAVESQAVESQAVESQAVESQAVESQAVESQAVVTEWREVISEKSSGTSEGESPVVSGSDTKVSDPVEGKKVIYLVSEELQQKAFDSVLETNKKADSSLILPSPDSKDPRHYTWLQPPPPFITGEEPSQDSSKPIFQPYQGMSPWQMQQWQQKQQQQWQQQWQRQRRQQQRFQAHQRYYWQQCAGCHGPLPPNQINNLFTIPHYRPSPPPWYRSGGGFPRGNMRRW